MADKKYWETPEFKKLNKEWREKLESAGFDDQEDEKENLKQKDERTIAFQNRDKIQNFYLKLDSYLTHNTEIPERDRKILELYSQGVKVKGKGGIVEQVGLSRDPVYQVIWKYKKILLNHSVDEDEE